MLKQGQIPKHTDWQLMGAGQYSAQSDFGHPNCLWSGKTFLKYVKSNGKTMSSNHWKSPGLVSIANGGLQDVTQHAAVAEQTALEECFQRLENRIHIFHWKIDTMMEGMENDDVSLWPVEEEDFTNPQPDEDL